MMTWFASLSTLQQVFVLLAAAGGALFLLRVVITFIGMGEPGGLDHGDFDHGGDLDHGGDVEHGNSGAGDDAHSMMSFKLLSFQGLTAFSMMFGLVGLGMSRAGQSGVMAVVSGSAAGLALVWISDRLFRFAGSLQQSGSLDLNNAVREEGTVYLTIPAGESGQVRITVQGRLVVLSAVSKDHTEIPTDTRVRVVGLVNENVLVVERA